MEDIEYYSIPVYNFPYDEEEDDEETILDNSELRVRLSPFLILNASSHPLSRSQNLMPFALVGSEEDIMINGEAIRGRRYPWGIVEVDNDEHCDFLRLRQALLS
jgi:cell division control protein 11